MNRSRAPRAAAGSIGALALLACSTAGSTWMSQPMNEQDEDWKPSAAAPPEERQAPAVDPSRYRVRVIGGEPEAPALRPERRQRDKLAGRVLGTFRNTYYDFPTEADFSGDPTPLYDAKCSVIQNVPRGFHDAVCVQGSGFLQKGQTVSFSRRDCECAAVCPRTQQKICFDPLDPRSFPWGRGATGKAITPLLTVAVDSTIIPLGTPVYIPEYDGLPRDPAQTALHDGCFLAEDRGMKVKGQHIDLFTGHRSVTTLWNQLVPSNKGVTVVLESPKCVRGEGVSIAPSAPSETPAPKSRKP